MFHNMAEDSEDFGDFTSAFNATSTHGAASTADQVNPAGGMDFFASFPPSSSTSGDQPLDFTSFDAFSSSATAGPIDGGGIPDFGRFDVADMNLAELKIPSPSHGDVHMAGGVAFDIPPITDDDFSDPSSPSQLPNVSQTQGDLFSTNFSKLEGDGRKDEISMDVGFSFPTVVPQQSGQPTLDDQGGQKDDSFGDFESSLPLRTDTLLKTSMDRSNLKGDSGTLTSNSIPAISTSDGNKNDGTGTTFAQISTLGDASKVDEEFGEFGDLTAAQKMTNTAEMETSVFVNSIGASNNVVNLDTSKPVSVQSSSEPSQASGALPPQNGDGFASFGQFTESTTVHKEDDQFGDFGTTSSSVATNTQVDLESSQFGDFGAFTGTVDSQENNQFGDFGTFSTASATQAQTTEESSQFSAFSTTTNSEGDQGSGVFGDFSVVSNAGTTSAQDDDFGTFGNFQEQAVSTTEPPLTTTSAQQASSVGDGFGAFADSTSKDDDFGTFTTSTNDDFGAFADTSKTGGDFGAFADTSKTGDDFGAFTNTTSKDDDFGDFTGDTKKEEDSFGDFSSTSGSVFGSFSTSQPLPALDRPSGAHAPKLKDVGNMINDCFPEAGSCKEKQLPDATTQLAFQLLSRKTSSSTVNDTPTVFWTVLQKSVDFTIPLKKWDTSYMQESYFGALKMDPVLVSKAGVLPLFSGMDQFESPLGGGTAMDLMESFGFEGGLESITQEPSSPTSGLLFRRRSSGSPGPALLDLSLPASPKSPNKDSSFTLDADLLSLDLNPQSQSKPLTSIQELLLNEKLVVNRSTWMDSELLELGGVGGVANSTTAAETSSQTSSQPSTPRTGKKQNSIELQLLELGLDASKTTLAKERSRTELSLTARTTLGRLPDLSFMLQTDKLVHSTYQPGQGAG